MTCGLNIVKFKPVLGLTALQNGIKLIKTIS